MVRYITNIVDVTLSLKAQKLRTLLMLRYVKIEELRTWLMLRYLKVEKLLGVGSFWTMSLACKTASQSKPSTYVPSAHWLEIGHGLGQLVGKNGNRSERFVSNVQGKTVKTWNLPDFARDFSTWHQHGAVVPSYFCNICGPVISLPGGFWMVSCWLEALDCHSSVCENKCSDVGRRASLCHLSCAPDMRTAWCMIS